MSMSLIFFISCWLFLGVCACVFVWGTLTEDSKGPDQTARMRSLIRAFAVRACSEDKFSLCAAPVVFN